MCASLSRCPWRGDLSRCTADRVPSSPSSPRAPGACAPPPSPRSRCRHLLATRFGAHAASARARRVRPGSPPGRRLECHREIWVAAVCGRDRHHRGEPGLPQRHGPGSARVGGRRLRVPRAEERCIAMPIAPFTAQSWLFVPPLDLPLALRLENGRFGALRRSHCPARRRALPRRSSPPMTRATRPAPTCPSAIRSTRRSTSRLPPATASSRRTADAWSRSRPTRPLRGETSPSTITRAVSGSSRSTTHVTDIAVAAGDFVPEGHAVRGGVRRAR